MPSNYILGKDGKLYLLNPDIGGTPILFTASSDQTDLDDATNGIMNGLVADTDYNIYENCRDVSISTDTDEVDITSRASSGFRQTIATIKDSTIEFEAIWKPNDAFFTWIKDAWLNSAEIAVLAMDGAYDTTGNAGLIGNFTIPGFSREEPIGDVMRVNVTMKGSSYVTWYEAPA